MKPLSHRLKPEIKEIFKAELNQYPTTMKNIMGELDSKMWVIDLSIGCVSTIASVTGLQAHLGTTYPMMFMVDTLSSLFEPIEINGQNL